MKQIQKKITQQQFFKLCTYLQGNEEKLSGKHATEILADVKINLGLEITRVKLLQAQESLGVNWIVPKTQKTQGSDVSSSITIFAKALANLYERLGEPVPEGVLEFSEGSDAC